ncbi:MAG: EAL domain-containing protein [Paracoccus denitrificans]|nr:MAG: EAL domain-containing protein [Paracoccus denitrificans]PZO85133.1 MAG: EAL domain-containing protein [Paracoccus denitrificans]
MTRDLPTPDLSPFDAAVRQQAAATIDTVRAAVARGNGTLAFQPIVQSERPDRVAFHEGLIRILDPSGRIIPLRDFMPHTEALELGRQIDCLSLQLGLQALAEDPTLRLSINLSARSITHQDWRDTLEVGLGAADHLAERLILEITESSAMQMPQLVRDFMSEFQGRGVSFALDDFGAGHTSFRYLRDFCFDMIKIDGQFVRRVADNPDNRILVQALHDIARHFDMLTVAESVETAEDAAMLIGMGIDCLQGFYFGAPTIRPPWRSPAGSAGLR